MSHTASRPEHLPDFINPPLNEVVLGVQFSPPKGYQQIHAGDVWNLFRPDYPQVQEQPPLAPSFETFGLGQPSMAGKLNIVTGASHDRFWFLRPAGDELIQFQQDRLLHNWRKIADESNDYPRFEVMIERFKGELEKLQIYLATLSTQALSINQCEISYVNHVSVEPNESLKASDWLRFISFVGDEPDDFSVVFREVVHDDAGKPCGRLFCEASTGVKSGDQQIIVMNLTVRGAPSGADINSALSFIAKGRELIVSRFAEFTTDKAHLKWGRIK